MLSTLSGIVIDVSFEQYLNVPSPMLVTLFGISTDVRRSQQSNARAPMLVTLLGISIDLRYSQLSSKAKSLDKGQIGSIDDKLLDYFPDYKNETVHTDGHSFTLCISTFGLILIT